MTTLNAPTIRVVHLYDKYLNIYADRGNISVLRERCAWREIQCEVTGFALDDTLDPDAYDLIYVGGGQDRDQRMIADRIAGNVGKAIVAAVEKDVVVLAVCGGYQLLGHHYNDTAGNMQPGAHLFDLETNAGQSRLIGNIAIECTLPPLPGVPAEPMMIVGFENHAGRTLLSANAKPLGRVLHGSGNNGTSGFEGCVYKHAIGTYLHGPLLPRNPHLADWLIAAALLHRYGDEAPELSPLNDAVADDARNVAFDRARTDSR